MKHPGVIQRAPLCPKCRALGSTTDCSDKLRHANRRERSVNDQDTDQGTELEVTIRFMTPITSTLDLDPQQMATHFFESWMADPATLSDVVTEALGEDFELEVHPIGVVH